MEESKRRQSGNAGLSGAGCYGGLVNALIHRSYLQSGSEVHIDMFDNRIEIYSPGGMVGNISLQDRDILKIPSKRRNPVLADIFNRLKYMERRGSGFKKIIMDYKEHPNYTEALNPVFEADDEDFLLTLFNMNYYENVTQDVTQGVTQDVTQDVTQMDLDLNIRMLIKNNSQISTEEMSELLKVSARTIKRHIKEMPDVSYKGSGYSGHWEIE